MAEALKRPGGELASRPLHFFWVVDCSGSMYGEKIGTVNHAIQSTIPEMVDAAKDNPNAQLLVRTLKFSTGATWVTPTPVNVKTSLGMIWTLAASPILARRLKCWQHSSQFRR